MPDESGEKTATLEVPEGQLRQDIDLIAELHPFLVVEEANLADLFQTASVPKTRDLTIELMASQLG